MSLYLINMVDDKEHRLLVVVCYYLYYNSPGTSRSAAQHAQTLTPTWTLTAASAIAAGAGAEIETLGLSANETSRRSGERGRRRRRG